MESRSQCIKYAQSSRVHQFKDDSNWGLLVVLIGQKSYQGGTSGSSRSFSQLMVDCSVY